MDVQTALEFCNSLLQENNYKPLSNLETDIFRGAWNNLTYEKIADKIGYNNVDYLKRDVGYKLWQKLSKVLLQKVTKKNCKAIIEIAWLKYQKQLENSVSNDSDTQSSHLTDHIIPTITPLASVDPTRSEDSEPITVDSQVVSPGEEENREINIYQCIVLFIRILLRLLSFRTLQPDLPEILNDLAVDYQTNDQLFIANILYHLTIICNPDYPVYYSLGSLYEKQNLLPQARQAYMIAINQKRPRAYNNLARLYIDDGQYEPAIELLQKAVELADNEEYIYVYYKNLGRAYMCLDQYDQATLFFQKAIAICATLPSPYGFLAIIKEKQGNISEAKDLWKKFWQYAENNHSPDVMFLKSYYGIAPPNISN